MTQARVTNLRWLIGPLLAGLMAAGCGDKHEAVPTARLPIASVRIQTVESKKRTATEEVVGTVRSKLRSTIEAKVSGRIDRMRVTQGQTVKAGELLAQLDVREIQARLDQARGTLDQAERDLKRFSALIEQRTVAQAEYDAVKSRHTVAQAAVVEAETMLSDGRVTAPFDGVVTRKFTDVGDLAAPGKPLIEIEDPTALRLEADVPEALIGRVHVAAKCDVRIPAIDKSLEGGISEIAPSADSNSRTFLVKVDLPSTPGLRAGMFGRMAVPISERTALRVPASAVVQRGQMEIVFVVAHNQAQLRLVKSGKRLGDEIELVSGVSAGEQVVTEGGTMLQDGQPIMLVR